MEYAICRDSFGVRNIEVSCGSRRTFFVALVFVLRHNYGRPLTAATVDDRPILIEAARAAIAEAFERAEALTSAGKGEGLFGKVLVAHRKALEYRCSTHPGRYRMYRCDPER